jgi:hypothetical protein
LHLSDSVYTVGAMSSGTVVYTVGSSGTVVYTVGAMSSGTVVYTVGSSGTVV